MQDKIEILQLIEEKLDPLTDNDILGTKKYDLKLLHRGIKEMEKSYEEVRMALGKFSSHKNSDIKELYQGAINFLDNQSKILSLVAKAIEKNPKAQSLDELKMVDMLSHEFLIFKIKSSYQTEKFMNAQEKVMKELAVYTDAANLEMENLSDE